MSTDLRTYRRKVTREGYEHMPNFCEGYTFQGRLVTSGNVLRIVEQSPEFFIHLTYNCEEIPDTDATQNNTQ